MSRNRSVALLFVLAAALAVALECHGTAQGTALLLGPAPATGQAVADAFSDGLVVRSRAMVASLPLPLPLLQAAAVGQAGDRNPLLVLNLFDDVTLLAVFDGSRRARSVTRPGWGALPAMPPAPSRSPGKATASPAPCRPAPAVPPAGFA